MVNVILAVDDFTAENGATVVAPGSHRWAQRSGPFNESALEPAVMAAGSALVFDGRLVHGAGANRSGAGRLGFVFEFVCRWLRPNENHGLAVPREVALGLDVELQELLGYNQHSPYMGFIAGQPPLEWLRAQARGLDIGTSTGTHSGADATETCPLLS